MSADLTYFWQNPRSTTTSQNKCGEKFFLSTTGHWNAKFKLIWFLYTFLFVLWGEGAIYGSYHYQPRDNLVFKEGGYHSMIKTWQCVRVSVYMADIFADIKWKNFQCKGQVSQEDILASSHWSFLPKFHCGCSDWKQKRALYDYRHYRRQIQIYCSHSQIFERVDILQCRSSFSNCCIQSNWLFFLII